MSQTGSNIILLTAMDLAQLSVRITCPVLSQKLSAIKNSCGVTFMTVDANPIRHLLSLFEDGAKETLSRCIKEPAHLSNLTAIYTKPLERKDRKQVHDLIRQLFKGKVDSIVDNDTRRIKVFLKGTESTQYHQKSENQPLRTSQQATQQRRAPFKSNSLGNNTAAHKPSLRTTRTTRTAQTSAVRPPPSAPSTAEHQAKLAAWNESAAKETARIEAEGARRVAAPPVVSKPVEFNGDVTYKIRKSKDAVVASDNKQDGRPKKDFVPPHRRINIPETKNDHGVDSGKSDTAAPAGTTTQVMVGKNNVVEEVFKFTKPKAAIVAETSQEVGIKQGFVPPHKRGLAPQ
jgi:hypothetical protein